MAIHDWTRVGAGIFHHFHHAWIGDLTHTLNAGLLPGGYYALAEQIASGLGPDVVALEATPDAGSVPATVPQSGGVAVALSPPKTQFHARAEIDEYAAKANAVVVRHASRHRVVAVVEIVSPGNKSSRPAIRSFAERAHELIHGGVHLMVLDLFPPGPFDPGGLHNIIWREIGEEQFVPPPDKPLALASYIAGARPEAFVEPVAVGDGLPDMPLFLATDWYVPAPLDATHESAWQAVPAVWRRELQETRKR